MHASVLEAPLFAPHAAASRSIVATALRRCVEDIASFLDDAVPLDGASHAEVSHYAVKTIWRKPECIAVLENGREVRLADVWQFVAFEGHKSPRSLLFRHDAMHLELQIDAANDRRRRRGSNRTLIGRDGAVVVVPRQRLTLVRSH